MPVQFRRLTIDYYVKRLQRKEYFAFVGYSDAEWYCIIEYEIGKLTGLGQLLDKNTGVKLLQVLQRRKDDPNFLVAVPDCLWRMNDCVNAQIGPRIEAILRDHDVPAVFHERDMVTDDLAMNAGLHPFIKQLQSMPVVVIGNQRLIELTFLNYRAFFGVSSPNLHMEPSGIQRVVTKVLNYGQPAVYLVSAGVSAALIIDQLYDFIPNSFFIDCGSIWDAFVGIGSQRRWRQALYEDPKALARWRRKNVHGQS